MSTTRADLEAVVNRQLAAYNRRDLAAFLAEFAADAVLYQYPDRVVARGHEALRERYARRFASAPNLLARVHYRVVMPPYVADDEEVVGLPDDQTMRALVIYAVRDGQIVEMRAVAAERA